MRPTTLLLLCLLFVANTAHALDKAQADRLVIEADSAYAAGEHAHALALYDSVNTAFTSSGLLYNMGNCHYRMGDVAQAILHYERALRLAPGDVDVLANLELARQQVKDRVASMPTFTLGSWWARFLGGSDPDHWARRSLWACALLFLSLSGLLFVHHRTGRRVLLTLVALTLTGTLVSTALAYTRQRDLARQDEAIIMTPRVDVRSTPDAKGVVLFILHKGTKVTVLQEVNGWQEIELANGAVGWTPVGTSTVI
ncbi:MAG TPA: tetratricopeptide repeat protein [Flavobacteriales bacterium]|nr:tetratricopeptide repeat protein [Flavobacteriales bacterium]